MPAVHPSSPHSQLRCPYVVQFLGTTVNPCRKLCVVLSERMERGCLEKVLHHDRVPLDWNAKLNIVSRASCVGMGVRLNSVSIPFQVKDTCCGMAFIHSHQMLHRNLLPCNILVSCTESLAPSPSFLSSLPSSLPPSLSPSLTLTYQSPL